jgi:hypothetical protein
MNQLSLFSPKTSTDLPPAVQEILRAAHSIGVTIVRGHWGIGISPRGRKWVLAGDCCCALGALLVVKGAVAKQGDNSASPSVARTLGILEQEVYEFIDGFDGQKPDDGSKWFGYGQRVARELGV